MFEVYALLDERDVVLTLREKAHITEDGRWVKIAEGDGVKYEYPQSAFFEDGITDEMARPKYKCIKGHILERSPAEIRGDTVVQHTEPSIEERVKDLEIAFCELLDALA